MNDSSNYNSSDPNYHTKNNVSKISNLYEQNEYVIGHSIFKEMDAVKVIERAWSSYRDKQMFKLLKHAICAAEHSLSNEILRKISPLEHKLLNDPCIKVRVRFRFAGIEFPPFIVFKVYTQTSDGKTSKYINGKNVIKPHSNAAKEACSLMGNKQYYNIILLDSIQNSHKQITDHVDIASLRDYMQYSSLLDDLPAYMGGKSNNWRRLNLTDLPRHTIFYDVINYATTKKMSPQLVKELPILLQIPKTQEIQLEQIKILSKLDVPLDEKMNSIMNSANFKSSMSQMSSRRSKNALNKISKMKKNYIMIRSETLTTDGGDLITVNSERNSDSFKMPEELNDEFEDEVKDLYMWTKNLSVNDNYLDESRLQQQ